MYSKSTWKSKYFVNVLEFNIVVTSAYDSRLWTFYGPHWIDILPTSHSELRGFPTFKSEIDPQFNKMSFWLYVHVISFAHTYP